MSRILCIIDGMTDPLFSEKEYFNLSSMMLSGYVDTTKGNSPESLNCILHLLGTEKIPQNLRGYAEALAEEIPVGHDDLILRGSWFSIDEAGRCGTPVAGPDHLPVPNSDAYRYYRIDQYKAVLIFPELAFAVDTVTTYPPYDCAGNFALSYRPKGCRELERCFDRWMSENKCLIPWGQSAPSEVSPFPKKAAVVCKASVVKGISRLLKMDFIPADGATGDVDTNLASKASTALKAAEQYPFVLLHINGADEAAHRKDAEEKRAFLRKIDKLVIPSLLKSGHEIIVVGDHGTDPKTGAHLAGLQPYFTNFSFSYTSN